jgi:competence protein ComEC
MMLTAICCAWVLGIFLGSIYHFPWGLILIGLVPVPFTFIFKKLSKFFIVFSFCLASLFGAAFYYPTTEVNNQITSFNNQGVVELKGVVGSPPDIRDTITHIDLSVQEMKINTYWQKTLGKVLLFVPRYPEYRYGDTLLVKGSLEDAPRFDNFDYQAYLSRQGIYSTMLNPNIEDINRHEAFEILGWVYDLRERLSQTLSAVLPEPQASLAQGIVLGIRSSIPDTLKTNLSLSGTAHLLAVSGVNLSIVAGIMVAFGLWLFGKRHYIYVWLALFTIWFYTLITGMQAPVIRSVIMATLFLLAELLGRQKNAYVAIAFSAAIMVGTDPQLLWSISFQLTFLSMMGLIFITPLIHSATSKAINYRLGEESFGAKTVILITDSFGVTLGALIAVWPLIAFNFGIISLIGPLATFLIAPSLPLIIVLGALTAVIGLFSLPAASIVGWIAWIFLSYMLGAVNAFAVLPMAAINTDTIGGIFIRTYYGLLALAILIIANLSKLAKIFSGLTRKLKASVGVANTVINDVPKKWVVAPLLIIAILTSWAAVTLPDDNLHVSVLDVGEGDSILIKSGNQNVLIDGGPSPQAICAGLSNKMPFWDRNIHLMVLTHPHLDHLSGLIEVLHRYKVHEIMAPALSSDSPAYQEWFNLIQASGIKYIAAQAGQKVVLRDGAVLDILNSSDAPPGDPESGLENSGIVARLSLNKVSFLFTADIGQEGEARLVNRRANMACTVLKVAHHGSSTSTTPDFLNAARPQVAVLSVGAENTFGHPDEDILTRLEALVGSNNIFRTDKSGTIEFTTDGQQLWSKTEK